MHKAAGVKAMEEGCFQTISEKWVSRSVRTAAWMRVEMSKLLKGVGPTSLPAECSETGQLIFRYERVCRRPGESSVGGGTRTRPDIYRYVVDGNSSWFVNFFSKDHAVSIFEHGLGTRPCGNSACCGKGGQVERDGRAVVNEDERPLRRHQ